MSQSTPPLVPPDYIRRYYAKALTPHQALALEALFALRSSVQQVNNKLTHWLGKDAITPGRLQVLAVLWSNEAPVPQRDVVNALRVSRATISELVEMLVREGHIETTASMQDKRQTLLTLTPTGRQFTQRLIQENADRLRQELAGLTDPELKTLTRLLQKLFHSKP